MDDFCGHEFWDAERTWNTTTPDFTPCFEDTVLTGFSCSILWLLAPIDLLFSFRSKVKSVPRTPLSTAKYFLALLLVSVELVLFIRPFTQSNSETSNIYPVEYVVPVVRLSTYILYFALLYFSKRRGVRSSAVQFLFWVFFTLTETVRFRTSLIAWQNEDESIDVLEFTAQMISFPCVIGLFILNFWADAKPESLDEDETNPYPEDTASFASKLFFHWFTPMTWKGYWNPIDYKDLWNLSVQDKSSAIIPEFDKEWEKEKLKADKKRAKQWRKAHYSKVSDGVTITNGNGVTESTAEPKSADVNASVVSALLGTFGVSFFFGCLLRFVPDTLTFVSPQILKLLIAFTQGDDEIWKGIFYAVILFSTSTIVVLFTGQHLHIMFRLSGQVRTALFSLIYKKALVLSHAAKRKSNVGEIVNLMSVDVQKIMDLLPFVPFIWCAPYQIGLAIYFLWGILGPSAFAGLAVMFLLVPINGFIASTLRRWQVVQMKKKDLRIKMMNEILSGVKTLKLYAWEKSFEEQVMKIRREEIALLKKAAYMQCFSSFLWNCSQFMVALATFATYVLLDPANVLDAEKAFVSLSLFNIIAMPLNVLPMVIAAIVQATVSIGRLNKYLNSEEIDKEAVCHDQIIDSAIQIEKGNFEWELDTITLKNITFEIKKGSLVAIVGPVGCGKSSLLSAILGEINVISGKVNTTGSIAYATQQAWIQNATVKENVLFGKPFEYSKYNKILECCDLLPDLEILPAGDKTEIGEKGINLSGGQKQRVSLARAAYNDADVYLLDDPLSAVDSHVGKHIFDKVLGPLGLLKRKTRVLVTHSITYLPQVDQIIVLKDGEISEIGTYKELLKRKGAFADFISQYSSDEQAEQTSVDSGTATGAAQALRRPSAISVKSITTGNNEKSENKVKDKLIEVEKSETASVKWSVYKDYLTAAGWGVSFLTLVLYFVVQGFNVGSNLWLSEWSNEPPTANGTQDLNTRSVYLGVYTGFGVMQGISVVGATICMTLLTLRSATTLHYKMLTSILHAPMSFFETTPLGRIVNRFSRDVDVLDAVLPFNLRVWMVSVTNVVAIVLVICYSTPIFIIVVIPVGVLYYFVQRFYVCTSRQLKRLESVSRSPIYSHFSESIAGASTIRAYSEQSRFIRDSETRVDHNQECFYPSMVASRWIQVRLELIGNVLIFFAALFAVLGRDVLSPGLVGFSVSYSLKITFGLTMLVRWTTEVETNIVAVERLKEYCEVEQEASRESPENQKPSADWPEKGEIRFEKYQTRYRPGLELVLKDVTCTINPGEKIGVVGRTGAGKSSLTLALFRIIEPADGTIVIDGKDISRLGLHDLRGRITIIPQDPVLFSGTLRINLDPFEEHSDNSLWESLRLAHLKDFVQSLPQGLDHNISEGGDNLSVGQRQLVCLARAVLRKTKILVLDEATAAIDLETDDLIQKTIRSEFKDSTVLTIAHRINTIMDSSRIMVLDKGEVKELESPQNLLKNNSSIFYKMCKDAGVL